MDNNLNYAHILSETLREQCAIQPRFKTFKISAVCDKESGNFLIIMTGGEKETWTNTILFYARLLDDKIVIEDDNFEEGLTNSLIKAGIPPENIINGLYLEENILFC